MAPSSNNVLIPAIERPLAAVELNARSVRVLELGLGWFPEQPGGLDRYFYHLLKSLHADGVSTRGLVVGSPEVAAASGDRMRAFASQSDSLISRCMGSRAAAKAEIDDFHPDLVASHFALFAAPALAKIRRTNIPHVVHFHGPWARECRQEGDRGPSNFMKRLIERRVYRRADVCIALSEAFARVLAEQYGVDRNRIRVIPGGVDIARFRPTQSRAEARQELGWPTGRPILLTVRRLVARMGLDHLVAAMDAVRRRHPDALLLIAGRGPMIDQLRDQVTELNLLDNVRLLGFFPDEQLPTAMRAADITVVPSTALEGFGLTVVESLAAGTPCLVSPIGGLPEVVRDLDPSLVFVSATAAEMADRILTALSGKMPLPTDERCAEFAAKRYDWDIVSRQVLDAYREAIREKN
jgi:glycosyltransferase involved in cell wall biosynthesis